MNSLVRQFLLGLSTVALVASFAVVAEPTHAIIPAPVQITQDPVLIAKTIGIEVRKNVKEKIGAALKSAAKVAFKNSIRVFFSRITEDTANYISTGSPGQKPLFITNPGSYLADVANSAGGEFLDSLSTDIIGRSVCQPLNITQQFNLEKAVSGLVLPTDSCSKACSDAASTDTQKRVAPMQDFLNTANSFVKNGSATMSCPVAFAQPPLVGFVYNGTGYGYTSPDPQNPDSQTEKFMPLPPLDCANILSGMIPGIRAEISTTQGICINKCAAHIQKAPCQATDAWANVSDNSTLNVQINAYLKPENNDLGQVLILADQVFQKQLAATKEGELSATTGGGFKPSVSPVSGQVKVPAAIVGDRAKQALADAATAERTFTDDLKADAIFIGNSLVKRLIQAVFNSKCGLNPQGCKGPASANSGIGKLFTSDNSLGGIAAAQLQFAKLGKVDYITGDASSNPISVTDQLVQQGLIDTRFKQAIDEQLTVQEAIDKGLLDTQKGFGYDDQGNEVTNGYSYRAILYLLHNRIVPVGWDLAARLIHDNLKAVDAPKSLGDLIKLAPFCGDTGFCANSKSTSCLQDDDCKVFGGDELSQVCKKNQSSAFCGLVDPGWVLKAPQTFCRRQGSGEETISRTFVCDEDTNGDGNVNCSNDPVSGGDTGNWLVERNTDVCADDLNCVVENPDGSCRSYGYCYQERPTFKFDGDSCPAYYASCQTFQGPDNTNLSVLANTTDKNGCTADNAGCTWYCRAPSIDATTGAFTCTADPNPTNGGSKIYFDHNVGQCSQAAAGCQQFVRTVSGTNVLPNPSFETYTGVIGDGALDTFAGWTASGFGATPQQAIPSDNALGTSTPNIAALKMPASGGKMEATVDTGHDLSGQVLTLSYYAKAMSGSCSGEVNLGFAANVAVPVNASKLYSSTWNRYSQTFIMPQAAYTSTKVTPQFFAGSCDTAIDNVQLENGSTASGWKDYGAANTVYLNAARTSCSSQDVGCDSWTTVQGTNAPIPAIATAADQCNADQVGCRTFSKTATLTAPERAAKDETIIPSTGKQCSAAYAGCEEYTNLDRAGQGGEVLEYYSYIRQCVKPDASAVQTFYSWVGSDVTGFQLRAQKFLQAGNGAPCTNVSVAGVGGQPTCLDANPKPAWTCSPNDVGTNPDCGEFYDQTAQVYYVLRSHIVVATNDCSPYRNTIDQESGNDLVYYLNPTESISCPASANRCREYKGSTGNNVQIVYSDNFKGDTSVWSGGDKSAESLIAGDTSLKSVSASGQMSRRVGSTNADGTQTGISLQQNGSYLLTFWAKPSQAGGATARFTLSHTEGTTQLVAASDPVTMTGDWNYYQLGPVRLDHSVAGDERLTLVPTLPGGGSWMIDNLSLQEVRDAVYLIDNTARSCTQVNCDLYQNRAGAQVALKSFSRLCKVEAVGCEALIDTQNSSSPFAQTTNGIDVSADAVTSVVYDASKTCKAEEKGCQRLGAPELTAKGDVTRFQDVYLVNDPDKYSTILCSKNEDRCNAFVSQDTGTTSYFKDPGTKTCEYRKAVNIPPGKAVDGWFIVGSNEPCATASLVCNAPNSATQHGRLAQSSKQQAACLGVGGTLEAFPRNGQVGTVEIRCLKGDGTISGSCQTSLQTATCITASGSRCITIPDFGMPSRVCEGGTDIGAACNQDGDCAGGGTCTAQWTGSCDGQFSGCNEYRDPVDPAACNASCTLDVNNITSPYELTNTCTLAVPGSPNAAPGCRPYYFLRESIDASAKGCNNTVNAATGCLPFFDSSLPAANIMTQ